MLPVSPLGVSKAAAHALASTYRQAHGMWVASAMLFNHASSRQSETYILRRITRGVGRIRHGLQNTLHLGRTDIVRDWCFAGDVVRALWLMAQRAQATDAVVATGRAVAVDDLVARALARAGLTAAVVETHHARCLRPVEIPQLVGDPTDGLALGWQPELDLFALVDQMVDHDLELAARERVLAEAGHSLAIDPLLI
jgi:GDPmannose 4,6-dehydratase